MLFQYSRNYVIVTHQFPTMLKKIKIIRKWKNDRTAQKKDAIVKEISL